MTCWGLHKSGAWETAKTALFHLHVVGKKRRDNVWCGAEMFVLDRIGGKHIPTRARWLATWVTSMWAQAALYAAADSGGRQAVCDLLRQEHSKQGERR